MKEVRMTNEVSNKLIQYTEVEKMSVSKARKKLLEEFPTDEVPSVSDIGIYLRKKRDESKELTSGIDDAEKRKDIAERISSSVLAIKDIDCLGILSETIETNRMLMKQALQNDVQIYSIKDYIEMQKNQIKCIDSYAQLMLASQKYALEERKVEEADSKGVSVGDADVKKALLELLQNNSGIVDSIDIPTLRSMVDGE